MIIVGLCQFFFFFFQAEDGIRDLTVTGVQTCALPISAAQEVELAKRIEAGVFAQHMLETSEKLSLARRAELQALIADGHRAKNHLLEEIGRASCRERV